MDPIKVLAFLFIWLLVAPLTYCATLEVARPSTLTAYGRLMLHVTAGFFYLLFAVYLVILLTLSLP